MFSKLIIKLKNLPKPLFAKEGENPPFSKGRLGGIFLNKLDEKGVALISALGLTLILFVAALGIIYRLTNFTQILGSQTQKNQSYYTASTGVEELRDYLWRNNCTPATAWCGRIGEDSSDPTEDEYSDATCEVNPNHIVDRLNPRAQCTPDEEANLAMNPGLMNIVAGGITFPYRYTLNIKDNADEPGVQNYDVDGDEVITAISTSVGQDGTRTTIEAMIIYTGGDSVYKQQGQGVDKGGTTPQSGVDLSFVPAEF